MILDADSERRIAVDLVVADHSVAARVTHTNCVVMDTVADDVAPRFASRVDRCESDPAANRVKSLRGLPRIDPPSMNQQTGRSVAEARAQG